MKDPPKRSGMTHYVTPPPMPPSTLTVDAAEFLALRTIVMAMVAHAADQAEKSGGPQAQRWINNMAEKAAEAIKAASVRDDNGRELEGLKLRAADQVTKILAGINFPKINDTN
jgi:hypothetical protein